VLWTKDAWPGLADGTITLTFRRWKRPQVVAGRSYRSPAGMLAVDRVDLVPVSSITEEEAVRAGAADREDLLSRMRPRPADDELLYRVELHFAGPDPRDELRETEPTPEELDDIATRLRRLDERSSHGPWTRATLEAIAAAPGLRAPDLAAGFGRETKPFKLDVRKLKALGLTESLPVGYRLSPRGERVLEHLSRAEGHGPRAQR
jgi:hypothetical protein